MFAMSCMRLVVDFVYMSNFCTGLASHTVTKIAAFANAIHNGRLIEMHEPLPSHQPPTISSRVDDV